MVLPFLLITLHAVLTMAAGIVLMFAPAAIPHAIGIVIPPAAFLLCYLLEPLSCASA